ncbi:MAG: NAD(P)/FAD-dependent oxidoreductase [Gammaproteobacteria bacterium]|nr:NAD(P)/FAD-dependent oxidoreductase [Gammaproteobacteria bacterium]
MSNTRQVDAVVVGAGFGGLYMLHRMRKQGLTARVIEAGDGVGGTWYWNRYPGARCDIQSLEYSYQFSNELQQQWEWSERYATQPEILRYINHVADRFDLRHDISFNARVTSADFDESRNRWVVNTDTGETFDSRFVVMATGCLSSANLPPIPGLALFSGDWYHTGRWPHEPVNFSGKRVAVIGTGSSAIQSIPLIAEQASELVVFQRTANYSVPAHNQTLDPKRVAEVKAHYPQYRAANRETAFHADFGYSDRNALDVSAAERAAEFERRWAHGGLPFMASFADLMFNPQANQTAAEFIRGKISSIVKDPETARKLTPSGLVGCKRLCVDTNYYATYNQPHVSLVDINAEPIETVTTDGIRTSARDYAFDAIVFATGFDAMTGAMTRVAIRGRGGRSIQEAWKEGPKTYLGLSVNGFPNLFMITGPGSPSVLTNMLPSIEHHVDWIADCIQWTDQKQVAAIEAAEDAQENWVAHVNEVGETSVYPHCNSWYLGANVPGKPRVFMPYLGFPPYAEKCRQVVAADYEGFIKQHVA